MIIVFSITTNNHNKQFIKMQHSVSSTHSGPSEETLAKLYNNVLTHSRRLRIPGWKKIDLMIDEVADLREYITHNIDNDLVLRLSPHVSRQAKTCAAFLGQI